MDQVLQVLEYSKTRNLNRHNIVVKFHCFNILIYVTDTRRTSVPCFRSLIGVNPQVMMKLGFGRVLDITLI